MDVFILSHTFICVKLPPTLNHLPKAVAGGDVISLRQHLAVIDVSGCGLAAAQVGDVALDVVFGVTVDKAAPTYTECLPKVLL